MCANKTKNYCPVDASPVKSFFVSMLTRDIRLEEAILDLLDNCVDGILRSYPTDGTKPYEHRYANITFDKNSFIISDNCGGIPWDLHEYAFRMGRHPDREPEKIGSVGVYGIGMKRAIFKMGEQCSIVTQSGNDKYEVKISPDWMEKENEWEIPVSPSDAAIESGSTRITINKLRPEIASKFDKEEASFTAGLFNVISTHYAYILEKGFNITINDTKVNPRTTRLVLSNQEMEDGTIVKPYVFRGNIDGVDVFLAVGFWRSMPSPNEIDDEQRSVQNSSMRAGWTILCNDRVVLHCDRSELTGWGDTGVPRFHNQFMAISGIVDFKSKDPSKLPTTTTKRGIDASSHLYQKVKKRMREGMKLFTNYTNKWKTQDADSQAHTQQSQLLSLEELKTEFPKSRLTPVRSTPHGSHFTPRLPLPPTTETTKRRIAFSKEIEKVDAIANFLNDPGMNASKIGEYCFDSVFEEIDD